MSYCKHCKVEILDETDTCPLCKNILTDEEGAFHGSVNYPDVTKRKKLISRALSIITFLVVSISIISVYINYTTSQQIWWSLIVVGSLLYVLWILSLSAREAGYLHRIFVTVLGAVLLVALIDWVTGFHRWSINFVLPGAMLLVDVIFIVLMIVNHKNWQGYMLFQLLMILVAFIPLGFIHYHVVTHPLVSEIAILSAIIVFLGTLILGGTTARTEMKRRFHI